MENQSGLATGEVMQVVNSILSIKEILMDESEVKLCRGCGEPDAKETCLCDPKTKVRVHISEQFKKRFMEWMSKDVLTCDDDKLRVYGTIAFFYAPSEILGKLLVETKIFDFAECDICRKVCSPAYYWGHGEICYPLCSRCAGEILN